MDWRYLAGFSYWCPELGQDDLWLHLI